MQLGVKKNQQMNKSSINVGLIGFGIGGQVFHAPIITSVDGLRLHKVSARRPEQLEILQRRYSDTRIVDNADAIIHADDIDLVVVATSNDMHYPFAKAALLAGKHVVVEKPFTNTTAEADELIALAKQQNLRLSVHHNSRWHSDYLTVRKVAASGRLGRLVSFEARFDRFRNALRPNAWREANLPGSGIWYDLGAHLVDQTMQLFGLPLAVNADLRIQRPGAGAVDDFDVILHYPNQLKASLKGSMLVKEPTPRYALYGMDGAFVKPGVDPQEAALRAGLSPKGDPDWGKEPREIWGKLNVLENGEDRIEYVESERGDYPAFYRNIYDAIANGKELAVLPEHARNVIYVIEMAEKSWAERRTVDLQF